jgi:hypothetical protein
VDFAGCGNCVRLTLYRHEPLPRAS